MSEDLPFLRAIFHRPDDEGLRFVYADWLQERGDPRAEFVRLDAERHRLGDRDRRRCVAIEGRLEQLQSMLEPRWVARMWLTRYLAPGARLDLISLAGGPGRIEVRGGNTECALLVDGKPVALNWDDCAGSVGQYLVYTGHTCGSEYVRHLTEFVAGDVRDDQPLGEQVAPLLALFPHGTYCLHYTPPGSDYEITTLGHPQLSVADHGLGAYYPADRNLACTQPAGSLHKGRVSFFRDQIRDGRRPIVLTASAEGAWCEFVIDGHHKLEAYNRLQVRPAILGIVRWEAPALSLDEGLRLLPRGHPGAVAYRRMKADTAR